MVHRAGAATGEYCFEQINQRRLSKLGTAEVLHGNALDLPIEDESVDLIITSPPYFALRSYQDEGEHYEGQIGSEETPEQFLEALWAVMADCWRVLKPTGSCWINLGDKYAGPPSGHRPTDTTLHDNRGESLARYAKGMGANPYSVRQKSLMAMPWRFAIGCIDGKAAPNAQQWILRAEVIWSKPNGLPESVTDRVRRSHEQWFHFTKQGKYFTGIDEIREPHLGTYDDRPDWSARKAAGQPMRHGDTGGGASAGVPTAMASSPLGKLPGSVWSVPSEPLSVPEELGIDHFAAFPTEWPRKIILGWSPSGICVECGEGRRPVVEKPSAVGHVKASNSPASDKPRQLGATSALMLSGGPRQAWKAEHPDLLVGYECSCPEPTADTRPAVILDPFGGTGTTAMVAKALGRHGISVDLSKDYCRLAEWRTSNEKQMDKVRAKTYGIKREIPQQIEGQAALFGE